MHNKLLQLGSKSYKLGLSLKLGLRGAQIASESGSYKCSITIAIRFIQKFSFRVEIVGNYSIPGLFYPGRSSGTKRKVFGFGTGTSQNTPAKSMISPKNRFLRDVFSVLISCNTCCDFQPNK